MTKRRPGRPRLHDEDDKKRIYVVCNDEEWEELQAMLEVDGRKRYEQIRAALMAAQAQEDRRDE